ncbi:MAG: hypothetical protein BHW25_04235 [Faecalibacterium sp. CAG:82-related_59_9]|nr:MAG: hypothetical protein BHW25_04235 [Faecalibacterium sp. CAG:82-related_59_9]
MKLNWNKRKKSEAARKIFRSGVYSAAVTALVLVLVILLNLIVRAIPSRYTEWDLSEAGLYTLSDNSIEVVKNLTQDVQIYYLAETGNEDVIISKLLDHYAAESSHLSWELKDPALYPTFATQYGATDVTNGSLILVCGENSTVLDAADLYEEDYSNYSLTGTSSVTFDGENKITSAIYRLTSGEEHHAYYTTNHGEQTLTNTLTSALENQNLTLTGLDMLSDSIPEDCDLLIINNPVQDFASAGALVDEMSDLRGYLSRGGKLLITTDSYNRTPNLDALLAEYGMTRQEGLVIENDSSYYAYRYPQTYLLPSLSSNDITAGITDGMHVFTPVAQGIVKGDSTDDLTLTTLLSTSSTAYSMQDYAEATTAEQGARRPGRPVHAGGLRPQ